MQESILYFFQNHSNSFLDGFFHSLSFLGEAPLYLAVLAWFMWNGDKSKGFAFSFSLMFSVLMNLVLKIIFRTPRPFMALEGVEGKRLATASGYSFPSGHTQNAATFYFSLYYTFRKKFLLPVVTLLVLLIACSRLYLGVHWPIDVFFGFIFGLLVPVLCFEPLRRLYESKKGRVIFLWVVFGLSLAISGFFAAAHFFFPKGFDFGDIHKFSILTSGLALGYLWESFFGEVSTSGKLTSKFLRYGIGLVIVFGIYVGIKFLLPSWIILDMIRYFLLGFVAVGFYPWLGVKLKLFKK